MSFSYNPSAASLADVAVVTMWGWKEWGHAPISWWLVVTPWLITLGITVVALVVLGIAKLFD